MSNHLKAFFLLLLISLGMNNVWANPPVLCFQTSYSTSFKYWPPEASTYKKDIILIHGLFRSSRSMAKLGKFLSRHGYGVYLYDYPSSVYSIKEHSQHFAKDIEKLLTMRKSDRTVSIITHSLGGIISRGGLVLLGKNKSQKIKSVLMLAPPNQGSKIARFASEYIPFAAYLIKPLLELSSKQGSYVHQVPTPIFVNIGIIAGRNDGTVSTEQTELPTKHQQKIIDAGHNFIMNNKSAWRYILTFLERRRFR